MSDEAGRLESDPGALAVARRLAALDLAAESRVRLSLRARLLNRPGTAPPFSFSLRWPAGLAGALAAAAVLLLFIQPRAPRAPQIAPPLPAAAPARLQPPSLPPPAAEPEEPPLPATPFRSLGTVSPFVTVRPDGGDSPFQTRPVRIEDLFVKPTL